MCVAIAAIASWVGYTMWQRVQQGVSVVPSAILMSLSAALVAFCLYNVLAGGNPPKTSAAAISN